MVRRTPPADCGVIAGTVPVVSFGDPHTAAVATLGINPSKAEFIDTSGGLLIGPQRRLATLQSLGATSPVELTDAQVAMVVDDCRSYFQRNPYTTWFNPLDAVLKRGLGVSYFDGTACHLDLVQWATDPVWGQLQASAQLELLADGVTHLQAQLAAEHITFVVVNGAQVWDQLIASGLADYHEVGTITFGSNGTKASLRVGDGHGARFVGWSLNLQSSFGVRLEDRNALADWLATVGPNTKGTAPMHEDHLAKTTVSSKSEFAALLRGWYDGSDADTIGDVGNFGGSALVRLQLGGGQVVNLNADTKRTAVGAYLATVDALGPDAPWRVIGNNKGVFNKVEFTPSGSATPGWYCYLATPAAGEGHL